MSKSGRVSTDSDSLSTPMYPWRILRAATQQDDSDTITWGTDDLGFDTIEATGNLVDLEDFFGNAFGGVVLSFYAASVGANNPTDGDTFGLDLVGYRTDGDAPNPPLLVCSVAGTGVLGALPVEGVTNGLWGDTAVLSNNDWVGDIGAYDSGNDRVVMIAFDACGVRHLYPRYYGFGAATQSPSIVMMGFVF